MLDFFVANSEEDIGAKGLRSRFALGGPTYWFLYRYFVHANLEPGTFEFLNPYEDTEISGYQLHRLECELNEALCDLRARPEAFRVLTGWIGEEKSQASEEWKQVNAEDVRNAIMALLNLLSEAKSQNISVFAIGV